jgi:hypothetical protein
MSLRHELLAQEGAGIPAPRPLLVLLKPFQARRNLREAVHDLSERSEACGKRLLARRRLEIGCERGNSASFRVELPARIPACGQQLYGPAACGSKLVLADPDALSGQERERNLDLDLLAVGESVLDRLQKCTGSRIDHGWPGYDDVVK